MKLIIKFNLVLLIIFVLGMLVTGYVSYELLQANARAEIRENARILMDSALAVRKYTNDQIKPLLATQMKYEFLPQSIPSYSATEYFAEVHRKYPEYSYKEATLNPTNPRDRAADWEADIVNSFRSDQSKPEVFGERDTPNGRALFLARPLTIKDPACLLCHSTIEAAPKTMVRQVRPSERLRLEPQRNHRGAGRVGTDGGTDRARGQCVQGVHAAVRHGIHLSLHIDESAAVAAGCTCRSIGSPRIADQVSLGDMDAPEFVVKGPRRDSEARRIVQPDEEEPGAGLPDDFRLRPETPSHETPQSARQVRNHQRARQGRNGHGLSRPGLDHSAPGCAQGNTQGSSRGKRTGYFQALPERGPCRGSSESSGHRRDLRLRRGR